MENEILSKILDKLISIESDIGEFKMQINHRFDAVENRIDRLDAKVDRLDAKVDRNYNHFLDYELQNATRHIELKEAIYKNKADVDYLKAIK